LVKKSMTCAYNRSYGAYSGNQSSFSCTSCTMVRFSLEDCGDALSCCGATNVHDSKAEKRDYLQVAKGEDLFAKLLKSYYFPFLLKYNRHVCFLWLAIFVVSIVFGPTFLGLTKSDLSNPAGTSSQEASTAFKENYPNLSQ
jgi:hypothetical protein